MFTGVDSVEVQSSNARSSAPDLRAWPLVQSDLRSGRKSLYIGTNASEIIGMTVPEGRVLLMNLIEHATQREFVYCHEWAVRDLVMWDSTATMHRSRHFDLGQPHEMRRTTTLEVALKTGRRAPLLCHERNAAAADA